MNNWIQRLLALCLAAPGMAHAELVITVGGDVNITQSRVPPTGSVARKWNMVASWGDLLSGIRPLLIGQINFGNLETVVTDRTDLRDSYGGRAGTFAFRAPVQGVAALTGEGGFNLFSLANNHTGDYGPAGVRETLRNMTDLNLQTGVNFAGVAANRYEALMPKLIRVQTSDGPMTIAFLSMTGVMPWNYRATSTSPGVLHAWNPEDVREGLLALKNAVADYRILSLHWGSEGKLSLQPAQTQLARRAVRDGDVDLILGHHPHRVHPVERIGKAIVFYSLGNYVMVGGASLDNKSVDHSYGLMGRIYLSYDVMTRKLVPQAVEAIPLTSVHWIARPLDSVQSSIRIENLNRLGKNLLGASVMHFSAKGQGGVSCLGNLPGPLAMPLCSVSGLDLNWGDD